MEHCKVASRVFPQATRRWQITGKSGARVESCVWISLRGGRSSFGLRVSCEQMVEQKKEAKQLGESDDQVERLTGPRAPKSFDDTVIFRHQEVWVV